MPTQSIREILKTRDNMNDDEIDELLTEANLEIAEILESSDNNWSALNEIDQLIMDTFGLEPDYIDDPELEVFQ